MLYPLEAVSGPVVAQITLVCSPLLPVRLTVTIHRPRGWRLSCVGAQAARRNAASVNGMTIGPLRRWLDLGSVETSAVRFVERRGRRWALCERRTSGEGHTLTLATFSTKRAATAALTEVAP